jgi:hypothetical protein
MSHLAHLGLADFETCASPEHTVNSIQNWIVDAFFPYSAAAMAAATLLRSITGCILPIFSQALFINLDYGWGGTLLALVSLVSYVLCSATCIQLSILIRPGLGNFTLSASRRFRRLLCCSCTASNYGNGSNSSRSSV